MRRRGGRGAKPRGFASSHDKQLSQVTPNERCSSDRGGDRDLYRSSAPNDTFEVAIAPCCRIWAVGSMTKMTRSAAMNADATESGRNSLRLQNLRLRRPDAAIASTFIGRDVSSGLVTTSRRENTLASSRVNEPAAFRLRDCVAQLFCRFAPKRDRLLSVF
jgi:hypothetical protein